MPEGDTLFRTARTLQRALAGDTVVRFASVFPRLTRVDHDTPIASRHVDAVEARGKHLLLWLSGPLALRTHMRMHGSWHVYRPGERWQRPRHEMRIVLATAAFEAVAFNVPVAEFLTAGDVARHADLRALGPDPLRPGFDADAAAASLAARDEVAIGEALLDQQAIAGIGNIFKSEALFVAGIHPFTPVARLPADALARLVDGAATLLRASAHGRRHAPFVYSRTGRPCRRCGTAIRARRQGADVRWSYWCPRCQPDTAAAP